MNTIYKKIMPPIITFRRWGWIIIYGFLAALLIELVLQIEWAAVAPKKGFNLSSFLSQYFTDLQLKLFLFIAGFFLYQFLLKMNIYSKKSFIRSWVYYPPISFSAVITIFLFSGYFERLPFTSISLTEYFSENVTFNNISYLMKNFEALQVIHSLYISDQAVNLYCLLLPVIVMTLLHRIRIIFLLIKELSHKFFNRLKAFLKYNENETNRQKNSDSISSESNYDEYNKWFKDDTPISNIKQLSVDLRPYAERIKEHIIKQTKDDKSVHLSICGGFGSGKSSIIKCVTNELDSSFIHSNIDTWGADTKSIGAFVLAKVVDDVADYVDMSAFKSLPSQYIEALKLGNDTSKLLAIFSTVSSDPKKGLKKLDKVLGAINKKLLITIQDVDRCQEPQKTTEELAALLDKLKDLNNISFIVALGYESSVSETIKKVCDYREDLIQPDNQLILLNFINQLNQKATDSENEVVISDISQTKLNVHKTNCINPYNLISSQRSFKHICRRIDAIWQKDKLMGEIDLECLCLLVVLREELPAVFEVLVKQKNTLIEKIEAYIKDKAKGDKDTDEAKNKESILFEELSSYFPFVNAKYVVNLEEIISYLHYLFKCGYGVKNLEQSVASNQKKNEHNDYFKRFRLEQVPSDELADQEVLRLFTNIDKKGEVESLIENFQNDEKGNHWIKAYSRFSYKYLTTKNVGVYFKIYTAMVDYYYQDSRIHINPYDRKIRPGENLDFLNSLIEKCFADEEYIPSTFEMSLTFPLFTNQNYQLMECFKRKKINLYDQLLNIFNAPNDVFNKLSFIDSSLSYLYESVKFIINCQISKAEEAEKKDKRDELRGAVVNTLIESCDKKQHANNLKIYFICYCLVHGRWSRDEQYIKDDLSILTKSNEMLLLKNLRYLDKQSNKVYLGDEQEQAKKTCQKLFEELSAKLPNALE